MNLKQLEYFVRVAELGSFSKAARILDVAQPALSRQVRLLETDLRTVLLQRTGRGVVLTESGKRLFEHSMGILQLISLAREDLEATRDEPTGRIVIALPPSMGRLLTLPLVDGFRESFPKAKLAIVEGLSTHITEWIGTGRVDIGLVLNPEAQEAIEVQPILDEPLCLVSPAGVDSTDHRFAAGTDANACVLFEDLPQYPLVIPERTHAIRKMIEAQAALAGIKLQVAWEVSGVQSILDLVRRGHGHAILTHGAVLTSGLPMAFRTSRIARPQIFSRLFLASSAHKPTTPLMRQSMRMIAELIRRQVSTGNHINS